MVIKVSNTNQPNWTEVKVNANLPENLHKLQEIAYNLWWVWNSEAKNIFRYIDNDAWHKAQSNPIVLLNIISYERMVELSKDNKFMKELDAIYADFRAYMDEPKDAKKPSVAYFSMEYGLTHVLKIYSGGLGVLAGDYLKEASDCNVDMTAIGFLYRYGYFTQTLSPEGQQIAKYEAQNFSNLPITQVLNEDGTPMIIEVPYPERIVKAVEYLSSLSGLHGMIGGQVLDLSFEKITPTAEQLIDMYSRKTGGLLIAAATLGCIAAGMLDQNTIENAKNYANNLGLAFQIIDDILDCTADQNLLGKPVGSDEKNNKTTFVTFYGIDKSRQIAKQYTDNAMECLSTFSGDKTRLTELTEYLLKRNY